MKNPKREILLLRWRWGLLLGVPLEGNLTCMIFAIGWPNWSSYSLLVLDINFFYPDFIRLPCMERQIDRCMYSINWRALPLIRELSNCIWFPDINVQWLYPDILWVHIRKADLAHINDPIGRYINGGHGFLCLRWRARSVPDVVVVRRAMCIQQLSELKWIYPMGSYGY